MKLKDKVLIVEDEQSISNFMSTILEANGFDTIVAATGAQARSMITSHCPDLIILEKENIRTYSAADVTEKAVSAEKMAETSAFYSAAAGNTISGYELLLENNFGMVFRKVVP